MMDVFVKWDGYSRLDFDKKKIRKVMGQEGRALQKVARKLVARRAVSAAGGFPGKQSGLLQRSIRYKVSKPGFLVAVKPLRLPEMGKHYYPIYLLYGVTGKPARADKKAQVKDGKWRIAPRGNYMTEALEQRRASASAAILNALQSALIPRK